MSRATMYAEMALGSAPRLLSALDREPYSVTRGSFDREHWAWKFRDWPRGMLQNSIYPVAMLWRHPFAGSPYAGSPRVLEWVVQSMDTMMSRQRANGAVDAFAPNDQDPGVSLMAVYNITEALRVVGDAAPPGLVPRVREMARKACAFAYRRDESHGFVSNHWALFALAYQNAGELLGDARLTARGEEIVARIVAEQSPDGWYREYEGPDPGYESLGIYYLAKYWTRSRSESLLESLARSVSFFSHFVHPDGGIGGVYGSRHTSLYFPGGFEVLAPRLPVALAIAQYMRFRLDRGNVVTPAGADAENLSPITASYLDAAVNAGTGNAATPVPVGGVPLLPCEALLGAKDFPHAGIRVFGSPRYYAIWHGAKGGVCRLFDRTTNALVHEDAGYLIRSGTRLWISQLIGMSRATLDAAACASDGAFTEWNQHVPTPWNFLVLRALNLTLFRSPALGNAVRNWIVKRLILTKVPGPFRFHRRVRFDERGAHFDDTIERAGDVKADEVRWTHTLTGIHMGSAKYFHPADLAPPHPAIADDHAATLNDQGRVRREFSVLFALAVVWLVAVGTPTASAGAQDARPSPTLIVHGVTVVDVASGGLVPERSIGIAGGRIVAVGDRRSVRGPRAREVNGAGMFAIPGLWDMHVEMALPLSPVTPLDSNPSYFFPLFLAWGVTGVRDVAGSLDVVSGWRDAIARGSVRGPRLAFTGLKIGRDRPGSPTYAVDSPDALRALIDTLARAGASDAYVRHIPADFYATLGAATREANLPFGGLISPTVRLADAVAAGQRSIDHFDGILIAATDDERGVRRMIDVNERRPLWARVLWKAGIWTPVTNQAVYALERRNAAAERETIALLARSRVYQVPTFRLLANLNRARDSALRMPPAPLGLREPRHPWNGWAAEPVANTHPLARVDAARRRLLAAMSVAGVPIMSGSDAPNLYAAPGMSLHDELELLVASGLQPLDALRAATRTPAEFLRAQDSLGVIAPGYVADLVLLRANPLADIRHTRRIGAVIAAGTYYDRRALDSLITVGRRAAEPVAAYWRAQVQREAGR